MADYVQVDKQALLQHLKDLAETKRALLTVGAELLETDPAFAAVILNSCRAFTTSSRRLLQGMDPC